MKRITNNEFQNADGSINTERAMRAGHDARSQAIRQMVLAAIKMFKSETRSNEPLCLQ